MHIGSKSMVAAPLWADRYPMVSGWFYPKNGAYGDNANSASAGF